MRKCHSCGAAHQAKAYRTAKEDRNYFYCEACAPRALFPCVHCLKPVRKHATRRRQVQFIRLTSEFVGPEFLETFVNPALRTDPETVFPGFGIPALSAGMVQWMSNANLGLANLARNLAAGHWYSAVCLCNDCVSVLESRQMAMPCTRCSIRFSREALTAVDTFEGGGQTVMCCRHCLPSMRHSRCARCNVAQYEHQMVWSDNHARARICRECAKQALNKPKQGERLVGFELEMLIPEDCNLKLSRLGRMHDDGSIHRLEGDVPPLPGRYYIGREFASFPASGDALKNQIKEAMTLSVEEGAYVNQSCGLHTHYDMSMLNLDARERVRWWWLTLEPLIMMMVPTHRRDNRYCRRIVNAGNIQMGKKDVERLTFNGWDNRYHALNLESFHEHGTYEVRLFHATLNPKELWTWTRFIDAVFKMAASTEPTELKGVRARERLAELLKMCALPLSVKKFLVQSLARYNSAAQWAKVQLPLIPTVSRSAVDPPPTANPIAGTPTRPRVFQWTAQPIWGDVPELAGLVDQVVLTRTDYVS